MGGQIKWTPYPWMNIISNNYGLGHDDLYIPNRGRIHTDDSIEIKYSTGREDRLDKMALTFTGDMGCEFGPSTTTSTGVYLQGVGCLVTPRTRSRSGDDHFTAGIDPKQSFIGYMLYNRTWFHRDQFALTVGGGQINNPGRYLVLDPPINGETAPSAAINAPYFTGNPSDPFKAWDSSITFDYMPSQYVTFRWEYDYRHASVPYWSGAGESRRRVRGECLIPTTDIPNSLLATTEIRPWQGPSARANGLRSTGQHGMVSRSAPGRAVLRHRHHGQVLVLSSEVLDPCCAPDRGEQPRNL